MTLADIIVNEGHSAEPYTEDLADQEIAKSMISFLLPRAIPLLKKASVKKPPKTDVSETMSARLNHSDNSKTSQLDDASGTGILNPYKMPNYSLIPIDICNTFSHCHS